MHESKALSVILSLLTAVFILTVSIAAPILLRSFYFLHIGPLELEARTGLSREQIVQAYDEMMDFCTGQTDTFSTGILPWSQSGRDHFSDVRNLFVLDLGIAASSGLFLLGWTLLRHRSRIQPYRFMKRCFIFWGGAGLFSVCLAVGALATANFSQAFVLFHTIFFPGKDNWRFDPRTDPIIRLLPEAFFHNCAILIVFLILLLCALAILSDLRKPSRK